MITDIQKTKWDAVEMIGWTRRAYGRRIMWESEGGTLKSRLATGRGKLGQLYLKIDVTGRMLVQVFCNGQMILEDLIAHGEADKFIDLAGFKDAPFADIELHLIPATFGSVKVAQDLRVVHVQTPLDRVATPA